MKAEERARRIYLALYGSAPTDFVDFEVEAGFTYEVILAQQEARVERDRVWVRALSDYFSGTDYDRLRALLEGK